MEEPRKSEYEIDYTKLLNLEAKKDVLKKKFIDYTRMERNTRAEFDNQVKVVAAARIKKDSIMHFGMTKLKAKLSGKYRDTYDDYSREETMAQLELDEIKARLISDREALRDYERQLAKVSREYEDHLSDMKIKYPMEDAFERGKAERTREAYKLVKEIDEAIVAISGMLIYAVAVRDASKKASENSLSNAIINSAAMFEMGYNERLAAVETSVASFKASYEKSNKEITDVNEAYTAFSSKYGVTRELYTVLPDNIEKTCFDGKQALAINSQITALITRLTADRERLKMDKATILKFEV